MYNNFYNPYGYNSMPTATQPFGMPMPPYYSNVGMQQQTQSQPAGSANGIPPVNTNKIFVTGLDDVKGKPLPPNSDMIFIDNDKPILYEKQVDATGKMTIKQLSLTECQESQEDTDTKNLSNYATKGDLDPLRAEIKGLKEQLDKISIQSQIDDLKKDQK